MPRWLNVRFLFAGFACLLVFARVASEMAGRARPYWHYDLRAFYLEQSTFYRHAYPHAAVAPPEPSQPVVRSDYPPSSFWPFALLAPPGMGLHATEIWFTGCQVLALAVIVAFVWRQGREVSRTSAVALCASVLAITGVRADLVFGNFALIAMALLVGMFWAIQHDRWWIAAALWLCVMLKPQMGWAFASFFVAHSRWRPLGIALAGLALLALAACGWTHISPFDLAKLDGLQNWWHIVRVSGRYSLVTLFASMGLSARIVIVSAAALGLAVSGWGLLRTLALASTLHRFAFVALVNRICMYHNVCDDILVAFALIWLGGRAWRRGLPRDWIVFCGLGLTTWVPTAAMRSLPAQLVVISAWIAVAIWLLWAQKYDRLDSDLSQMPADRSAAPHAG